MTKIITSPAATILFSALRKPQNVEGKEALQFTMRVEVEAGTEGAEDFRNVLTEINSNLLVTKTKNMKLAPGNYIFNARSTDKPAVYDREMNRIAEDEIPMINSGTARLLLTTFESKSGKGGGISLVGVQLLSIEEYLGSSGVSEDDIRAALQKANS